MKKILLVLCTLSFVILAGCGKENSAKQSTPYKIIWYSPGSKPQDLNIVMDKVNQYLKKKINAELEMKYVEWGDYSKKMNLTNASGEPYDICFAASWGYTYAQAAKNGYLYPLNKLMEKYGKDATKAIGEASLKSVEINGELYGIPIKKEEAMQAVYIFNKKYVDKYKFDLSKIKSLKDLDPMFKVIKENEPAIVPLHVFNGWTTPVGFFQSVYEPSVPAAVLIEKGNHKVVNIWKNKRYLDYLNTLHSFYEKGYIPKAAATDKDNPAFTTSGRWFCRTDLYQPFADGIWSRGWGFPVVSVPAYTPPVKTVLNCFLGISATAENPEIDMKFLNLLNSDKYLRNLIGYGIEGIHYKKDGENRIKLLPRSKDYNPPQFTVGNLFLLYVVGNEPSDKWKQFKTWNESAIIPPLYGFTFDPSPVKTEIASIMNILSEANGVLEGVRNAEDVLPAVYKKLNKAGWPKLVKEMQKQIDEWYAKKEKSEK